MVNIYKLELTTLQQEIVNLLFIKIGPLNGRRISQILGVSPPAIGKALPELERKEYIILKKDKESLFSWHCWPKHQKKKCRKKPKKQEMYLLCSFFRKISIIRKSKK